MNTETGELKELEEAIAESMKEGRNFNDMFTNIGHAEMTEKQQKTKQVSKYDNKSILGKKFTKARRFKKNKFGRI